MSVNNKIYNFGILGCGMIADIHAKAIGSLCNAKLSGVADHVFEKAECFATKYGTVSYESYEKMLSDPRIDIVCICTPSGFHADNAVKTMEMGKHVILEKPIALDTESADRVIEACKRTGRYLTVISQLRFSDDIIKVKKLIDDKAFGKIALCSLRMKYYRTPEYYSQSSWKGTKKFDGGALMNQGIHGIDILLYLAGPIKTLSGTVGTLCHDIEVEDTAVAALEFESGALGVLEASTCAYPGFERKIEIHGDEGYVILSEKSIEKLMIGKKEVDVSRITPSKTASNPAGLDCELHSRQIQSFINSISSDGMIASDCYEGRKAVDVIERIYKSHSSVH